MMLLFLAVMLVRCWNLRSLAWRLSSWYSSIFFFSEIGIRPGVRSHTQLIGRANTLSVTKYNKLFHFDAVLVRTENETKANNGQANGDNRCSNTYQMWLHFHLCQISSMTEEHSCSYCQYIAVELLDTFHTLPQVNNIGSHKELTHWFSLSLHFAEATFFIFIECWHCQCW